MKRNKKLEGFTLVELMIVVVIIGVLSAIAIPAFINYVKQSKTSEVPNNLKAMFTGAATFYNRDVNALGGALSGTYCAVPNAAPTYTAGSAKQAIDWPGTEAEQYELLGFAPADPIYYEYHIEASPGVCGTAPSTATVYNFVARGDIDGDGAQSQFLLQVGSNPNNELFRPNPMAVTDELE